MDTKHIDFTIDSASLEQGARKLAKLVIEDFDSVDDNSIRLKRFTEGSSNQLIGVYTKDDKSDMVLIRISGESTNKLVNRTEELLVIKFLTENRFGSKLIATFNNGIITEFLPGQTLTPVQLKQEPIATLIALQFANLHEINFDHVFERKDQLFAMIDKFVNLADGQKMIKNDYVTVSKSVLEHELHFLQNNLMSRLIVIKGDDLVFSHNDLNAYNVIYDAIDSRVNFIDFEYASVNNRAFDIANHMIEHADIGTKYNSANCPDQQFKLHFIRSYLREIFRKYLESLKPKERSQFLVSKTNDLFNNVR